VTGKAPISERREEYRATAAIHPLEWHYADGWLRAELADLERACEASFLLRIRTRRLRTRVRREAAACLASLAEQVAKARRDG
jgi:hypothetical protein